VVSVRETNIIYKTSLKLRFVGIQSYKTFPAFLEFSSMNSTRDEKLLKRFGQHLQSIRTAHELSLRELADEADVDFSMIHRIEKGKANPSLTMLVALAKALNMTVAELVTFT
jgi:DNA-binding XRE family transcriptional regulator